MTPPRGLAVVDSSFLPHPGLPPLRPLYGPNPATHDHGTRSLGVVLGEGIAPVPTEGLRALACPAPGLPVIDALHEAMLSCLAHHPRVLLVNLSFDARWPVVSAPEIAAMARRAWEQGCLCVFPAGNAGEDLDRDSQSSVASLGEDAWLLVGAKQPESGEILGNRGGALHLFGPGAGQHTLAVDLEQGRCIPRRIAHFGGTSAAASWVSAVALTLAERHPDWGPQALKERLLRAASQDPRGIPQLSGVLGPLGLDPDTGRE